MRLKSVCAILSLVVALSACESLPSWMGGSDEDKPKLPGNRIAVLNDSTVIKPDDSLANATVAIPAQKINHNWRQAGGSPQGMTGNLQISGFKHDDKESIGEGNAWEQPLYSSPIVDNGVVYAMDSKGYVTAYDAAKISTIKWQNKSAVAKHEPEILGGGLAFDAGRIFVTTGRGWVYALDAASGKENWRQYIGIPLRAAPKAGGGRVYVVSVDNQLFALDAEKGTQLWTHRGINENAGFLASVSAAMSESVVIAPYSSGEIHALDSVSGQALWSDLLLKPHRTSATSTFSGVGGTPIIKDDTVYAAGSSGFVAAFSIANGRHLWEQDISSLNTLWIADDFMYMLSADGQVVCLLRGDGRIKWVQQLPRYEDEKKQKNPYTWFGPVMAGDQLLLAGAHGKMLALSPVDGSTLATMDIPEDIAIAPIVADGRMYLVTKDAKLHVLY